MAELRRCAWSPDCCSIPPEGQRYCTRHSPEGAPHGVREQSALELLETHAKALEAENERLRGDLAICRQLNASEYGKACAENERLTRERDRLHKQLLEHAEVCGESAYPISDRVAVETPEKLWYIECNKCGRQDNPGYGCNALQPDGTRCNGTMRRTRLLFESNFGTPPDPRPAVETAAEPIRLPDAILEPALARITHLMASDPAEDSPEGKELSLLAELAKLYEKRKYPEFAEKAAGKQTL